MKKSPALFAILLSLAAPLHAQIDGGVPLLTLEEKEAIDAQSASFNRSLEPLLADAAQSTVRVWSGTRRLAYGTVVGDGSRILTKWSELARSRGDLRVEASGRELRAVNFVGVYPDYDLALLAIDGEPLVPVRWSDAEPGLGGFLAAPQPDGRPAAFGVVGVPSRNLKLSDQAFLGVHIDPQYKGTGVKVSDISKDSGALRAGLEMDDIILSLNGREVNGLFEMRNSLSGISPGTTVPLVLKRGDESVTLDVELGARPVLPRFPGGRIQQMERMGGPISSVRDDFPSAIESDMRPLPNQISGPVVDLKGQVVGITLARAGRTRSYIMPSSAIRMLLETEPEDPEEATKRITAAAPVQEPFDGIQTPRANPAPDQGNAPSAERLGRHLSDMQRLLELMWEEMEAIER